MTLSIKARLQLFKTWKAVHPTTGLRDFRSAFKQPFHSTGFGRGADGAWDPEKRGIYHFYSMPDDFRPQPAHKVAKLGHTGWYSDNNQDILLVPHVFQLPSNRNGLNRRNGIGEAGRLHYFPGYQNDCSGVVTVDLLDGYDSATSAAYAADSMAERAAEEERDFDAQQLAEHDIEEARGEIHRINQKALQLRKNSRRGGKLIEVPAGIAEALDFTRRAYIEQRAAQLKIISARQENYWSAVFGY